MVVNAKGERLFDSWNGFISGSSMDNVPIYTFDHSNINTDHNWYCIYLYIICCISIYHRSDKWAWIGSDSRGMRDISGMCKDWRSESGYDKGQAASFGGTVYIIIID